MQEEKNKNKYTMKFFRRKPLLSITATHILQRSTFLKGTIPPQAPCSAVASLVPAGMRGEDGRDVRGRCGCLHHRLVAQSFVS